MTLTLVEARRLTIYNTNHTKNSKTRVQAKNNIFFQTSYVQKLDIHSNQRFLSLVFMLKLTGSSFVKECQPFSA